GRASRRPAASSAKCKETSDDTGGTSTNAAAPRQCSMTQVLKNKKALILESAREINAQKWTPAEIEQLRLRLLAEHGEAGKTGTVYIADVLKDAGHKVLLSMQEVAEV